MFCSQCGSKAVEGAVFCQKCGVRLPVDDAIHFQPDKPAAKNESAVDLLDVTLVNVGVNKVYVIKTVRGLTGLGLKEARELVESTPVLLKKGVTQTEAITIKETLMNVGAIATFTNQEGSCVDIIVHCKACGTALEERSGVCKSCGRVFASSAKFETATKEEDIKDFKVLQSAERQRKTIAIVVSVASALIIIAIALEYALPGSLQRMAKPGIEVRGAYLSEYSNTVTVEKAFNNFFDNEKWSTYEAEGYSYVAFTGACEFMQEKAEIRITFKITGEQFFVDGLDLNGREQGDLMLYSLLSKVYEEYEEE